MARNNSDRSGTEIPKPEQADAPPMEAVASGGLNFVTPTEFVDLPSKGKYYPEGHPLHNEEVIEMRYMTAKEEDILPSPSLLKKGVAIDRVLQNLIVPSGVNIQELVLGDRAAMILSSRISAYGADYIATVTCPACGSKVKHYFDLNKHSVYHPEAEDYEKYDIVPTERGTFKITLPRTKVEVEVRLMRVADEQYFIQYNKKRKKHNLSEATTSEVIKRLILSANGETDKIKLSEFAENMPAFDARYLRSAVKTLTPSVDNKQEFACSSCGFEQDMEVPFGIEFFWPQQ